MQSRKTAAAGGSTETQAGILYKMSFFFLPILTKVQMSLRQ
jgi:hypothetical protein